MDDNEVDQHKDTWKFIKKHLNDMKEGEDITFDQLLVNLKLTEQNYLLAVQSSLKTPTIFLKRKPNELRINNYNAACLSAWRANMDIQFVLDVYACAIYIVSYISKAQKGMSELLRTAYEEAKRGNSSIKQQVRDIGNRFLNNVEISAQEAVYIVLQLPMRKSSRQVVFINTSPPEDRVQLLKPLQEINDLEDDSRSDEIYASGLIKRYTKRPARLENVSLADWAAWYDSTGKPYIKPSRELDIDNYPLETNLSDNDENNEEEESEQKNKKDLKPELFDLSVLTRKYDENYDLIAPGTQNIERQDEGAQDLHPEFNETYDLSGDFGIPSAASNTEQLILHEEQDDAYRGMWRGWKQLEPVMDRYIFKNLDNSEYYAVLAPNKWHDHFNMFELEEIMRQRESKVFAEILNRLREGKHTKDDILKLKERLIKENSIQDPMDVPHLFIQNQKVNEFNERVHNAATGANSAQLRDKILSQIPDDPRKTRQIASNLQLSVGESRTDDGMTNGAGNVVKKIQLNQIDKPSGIIWVQFDHSDVGEKTRHENRHLYVQGIKSTWTPIKPITTQFAVGRNQTAQVVRKQFPLGPAAAKTIHRSQGDTEQKIVVNFNTRRTIPHIHYVGLSRVTAIEGLFITDLCEDKIAVNPHVASGMEHLRN
ncbi:Hypothetical predicted protein [Paramuricea clavata]|uniref:Uncharacterized protein n=1 Tax=Paramuricea clavata TaxID=317549 RepID=A0A7D9HPV2_PARCT|nr:Hypothetical predicted protein [Paramuricea clavata]